MTERPPCWLRAWSKAHGVEPGICASSGWCSDPELGSWRELEGWKVQDGPPHHKHGPLIPAHDSDAWLAGIVRAVCAQGQGQYRHISLGKDSGAGAATASACDAAIDGRTRFAPTLEAAICAAVRNDGEPCDDA